MTPPEAACGRLPPGGATSGPAKPVPRCPLGFLGLAIGLLLGSSIAQPVELVVHTDEPRAYGHVVGDVIERRASIALPAGQEIVPDSLPRLGRVDVWFELRDIELSRGNGQAALWLRYQVMNAPQKVTTVMLPALHLDLRQQGRPGPPTGSVTVSEWPVSVGPLTPQFVLARAGLQALQPDIEPVRAPVAALAWRLLLWGVLLGLASAAWHLHRHPELAFWRRHAPFRQAWRHLRRLARGTATPVREQQALQRVHQAFNATAGCALFAGQLEPLYAARPALRAAAPQIEAFFAASQRCLFAGAGEAPPLPHLTALCQRLAGLEAER